MTLNEVKALPDPEYLHAYQMDYESGHVCIIFEPGGLYWPQYKVGADPVVGLDRVTTLDEAIDVLSSKVPRLSLQNGDWKLGPYPTKAS